MRLNQYIAESGMCSRREADKLIENSSVTVNGTIAALGMQVTDGDIVKVNGERVQKKDNRVVLLVNKPKGITSTTDKSDKTNIIDFINYNMRLFTIGRLDKDSEGAILLTNDGNLINSLLRSEYEHEKTYIVKVDKVITDEFIQKMSSGVKIYNPVSNTYVTTKPCKIKKLNNFSFEVILTQGLNRQIRRMCRAFEYKVTSLVRVKFLFLTLENLKPGQWRELAAGELNRLYELAENPDKLIK